MEGKFHHIFTIVGISIVMGVAIYAQRKKIKWLLNRRVTKVTEKDKNFIKAVGQYT